MKTTLLLARTAALGGSLLTPALATAQAATPLPQAAPPQAAPPSLTVTLAPLVPAAPPAPSPLPLSGRCAGTPLPGRCVFDLSHIAPELKIIGHRPDAMRGLSLVPLLATDKDECALQTRFIPGLSGFKVKMRLRF